MPYILIIWYGKVKNMKRILFVVVLLLAVVALLAACGGAVQFKLNFIVDGEVYATIDTSGNEAIKMPEDPTKEGDTFDGWYWDKDWMRLCHRI